MYMIYVCMFGYKAYPNTHHHSSKTLPSKKHESIQQRLARPRPVSLEWPRAETGKARNGRGRKLVNVVPTRSEFPGFARSTVKLGIPASMRYPLSVLKNSTLKLTHSYLPADVSIMRSTVSRRQLLAFRVSSTKEGTQRKANTTNPASILDTLHTKNVVYNKP